MTPKRWCRAFSPARTAARRSSASCLFTPLRFADGARVLVNRGFVPPELREPAARPQSRPAGEATLTGTRPGRGASKPLLRPPTCRRSALLRRGPGGVAAAEGLDPSRPSMSRPARRRTPAAGPAAARRASTFPNNHLQYALTWFGLALTLVCVFGAFARKRLRPDTRPHAESLLAIRKNPNPPHPEEARTGRSEPSRRMLQGARKRLRARSGVGRFPRSLDHPSRRPLRGLLRMRLRDGRCAASSG